MNFCSKFSGMYCSGWVKRGPIGVIVSTMNDGFETAKNVVNDLHNGTVITSSNHKGHDAVLPLLEQAGICTEY